MNPSLQFTLSPYSTIIIVGWWTGWHIQPIVSLTRHIKNTDNIPDFLWIWGSDSQEEKVAKEEHIRFNSIPTLKLTTTKSFKILLYPFFLKLGFWRARRILSSVIATKEAIQKSGSPHSTLFRSRWQEQICIFSKWWPGSVAIGIAAWTLWIPLYIHESDTIPGRSNRILAKIATRIFLGFESAGKYFDRENCEFVWQILDPSFCSLRKELSRSDWGLVRENSKTPIPPTPLSQGGPNWKTTKKHILVICGSQWSQVIFEEIIQSFSWDDRYEWIIALGKLNSNIQNKFGKIPDCQAVEWISQEDIASLLNNTDLAITRGSATTLAEIDIFGVRKIIVPLPYSSSNHQYWNAKEYERKWDILLEQKNLHELTEIITKNVWYNK